MIEMVEITEKLTKLDKNRKIVDKDTLEILNNNGKIEEFINTAQGYCDEIYEKDGFNEELLDIQISLNILRNEHDITDPKEIIHVDNGKGFVQ